MRLVPAEVVEVVHDGAAQMAEHEPEDGLENFLGCGRHAGRVSQLGIASRKIVRGESDGLCRDGRKVQPKTQAQKPSLGHPPPFCDVGLGESVVFASMITIRSKGRDCPGHPPTKVHELCWRKPRVCVGWSVGVAVAAIRYLIVRRNLWGDREGVGV